ncbi:hypothetical protein DPMN_147103 [Dreissena polymorpha]|uniref:Uncharacterized protein n=1 Tax=Dreissena polymorpha TaxID=45954 RepID=A0A9D4F976_DREPO|nr:hypothetical protein DPMN_147103 [Dreissena polymorpha]
MISFLAYLFRDLEMLVGILESLLVMPKTLPRPCMCSRGCNMPGPPAPCHPAVWQFVKFSC